jgi:Arc/MetJ family transcription regulator
MATNLGIDEKLLNEALRVGGHRTKKATVNEALEEYIAHRKRIQGLKLFGTIEYDSRTRKTAGRRNK